MSLPLPYHLVNFFVLLMFHQGAWAISKSVKKSCNFCNGFSGKMVLFAWRPWHLFVIGESWPKKKQFFDETPVEKLIADQRLISIYFESTSRKTLMNNRTFSEQPEKILTLMTKISTNSRKQRNIEENYVISNSLTFSVKTYKYKGLDISTGREYTS